MSSAKTRLLLALNVAMYVALAVLPVTAMLTGWRGKDLYGAREDVKKPKLRFPAVWREQYQHKLDAWFQRYLGFTGTSIGIDNSILFHLFGEAKAGSTVRVGEEGTLYIDDDINYYNKSGAQLPPPEFLDSLARRIATLQKSLGARGKAVVPVIVPSKTSIYPEAISANWTADLGSPRPSDVHVYQALVRALDAHGVRYVDVRALITKSSEPRHVLWVREARHWSGYAGCKTLVEVTKLYAEMSGKPRPPMQCTLKMVEPTPTSADFDLLRLLNALLVTPERPLLPSFEPFPVPPPAAEPLPTVSVVATSFGWTLTSELLDTKQWSAIYMNYYNSHLFKIGDNPQEPLKLDSPLWREAALDKDLYILDLFEGYLGPNNYVDQFIEQAGPRILAGEKP